MIIINSANNETIKNTIRLKKARERRERGLIVVDGEREIDLAVKSGLKVETMFFCSELVKNSQNEQRLLNEGGEKKIIEIPKNIFTKICYKESPDGYLATIKTPKKELKDICLSKKPLVVVLENVEKPGNLGAIIRSAYAVGADAVIINDNQTDIFNPNVIRASEGFIFKEPVVNASREETIKWLKKHNIISFAAATSAKKIYTDSDLGGAVAIILGSEANGLSQEWLNEADELIKIPMAKDMDSLNVSVSAAIISFEALRQRGK